MNGYVVDSSGKVARHLHGVTDPVKALAAGESFLRCDSLGVAPVGALAPPNFAAPIAATDDDMARVAEDLAALLLQKGVVSRADLPAPALAKINARRQLRGAAAL